MQLPMGLQHGLSSNLNITMNWRSYSPTPFTSNRSHSNPLSSRDGTFHTCKRAVITNSASKDSGVNTQKVYSDVLNESDASHKGWSIALNAPWKSIRLRCCKVLDDYKDESRNSASPTHHEDNSRNFTGKIPCSDTSYYINQDILVTGLPNTEMDTKDRKLIWKSLKAIIIGVSTFLGAVLLVKITHERAIFTLKSLFSRWFSPISTFVSKAMFGHSGLTSLATEHHSLRSYTIPAISLYFQDKSWSLSRLSYVIDVLLEKHPISYIILLAGACCTLVCIGGILFHKYRNRRQAFEDAIWDAWSCLCSSGRHLKEETRAERIVGLMLAIGGLLFYSLLTSTMTAQFKSRMEWLREGGHSQVMEDGHVLICGVNSHLSTVLKQLNKSEEIARKRGKIMGRKQTVLVLCEKTRKEMEKRFSQVIKECSNIEILTRSGNLKSTVSFQNVAAEKAKAIIILSTKDDWYESDAQSVLSVLGLQPLLEGISCKVVVEVCNLSTAELLKSYMGTKVSPVQNLSSKLFVQCSRQQGLVQVYWNLLDHGKQVINLRSFPSLAGIPYQTVRKGFPEAIVCGLIRDGKIDFHPKDHLQIKPDDKLILIATKDSHAEPPQDLLVSQFVPSTNKAPEESDGGSSKFSRIKKKFMKSGSKAAEWQAGRKERIIILGWHSGVPDMIFEYDDYVGPGSQLVILSEASLQDRNIAIERTIGRPLRNVQVTNRVGNPMSRTDMRMAILDLSPTCSTTPGPSISSCKDDIEALPVSIVVVADKGKKGDMSQSDMQSVYSLLLAEDLCKELDIQVASLSGELMDTKLGEQVVKSRPSLTYIGTDELMGLVTAQVSEQHELNDIWTELLNSWGNEIYVKNISRYLKSGERVSFQELSERAILKYEVAIGYKRDGIIVINPPKKNAALSFNPEDSLVVISEFEHDSN